MTFKTLRRPVRRLAKRLALPIALLAPLWLAAPSPSVAQLGAAPAPPPADPRAEAPQDFTGYWVAIVTEDWRFRMLTPDKGDFAGVPINAAGRRIADEWDPKQDEANGNQCRSYGAAGIMRVPERLHITWVDDKTLRIETDAGEQVRLLHFGGTPPPGATPSWQGYSVADWEGLRPRSFAGAVRGGLQGARPAAEGYLKVVTTELRPGYLRKNGVPYGPQTSVLEYFDGFKEPNGDQWLVVTTIVTDPEYLNQPFVTSSHFKKLADASGWHPTPCEAQ
jgi:hypothetical protein